MESFFIGAGGLLAGLILGSPFSRRLGNIIWYRRSVFSHEKIKLVIVVRPDLGMTAGKVAAQCGHAAVMSYQNVSDQSPDICKAWLSTGQQKVVVRCDKSGEQGLLDYFRLAKSKGIVTSSVVDAGHTQVRRGTLTVVGIGPGPESLINEVTGKLRPF